MSEQYPEVVPVLSQTCIRIYKDTDKDCVTLIGKRFFNYSDIEDEEEAEGEANTASK